MKKILNFWKNYSLVVLFAFVIFDLFDIRIAVAAITVRKLREGMP